MSLPEDLRERLRALDGGRRVKQRAPGASRPRARGSFSVVESREPLCGCHGRVRLEDILGIDPCGLASAGRDEALRGFRAERAVFFDLETTGLAGGAGTVAFLVGAAHLEGGDLVLRQYFLEDLEAEALMLREVHDHFRGFDGLVTYNGKSFDLPLLRSRLAFTGVAEGFSAAWHLDLLHLARSLWRRDLGSCRLKNVECRLLGLRREGDVEGRDIPPLYWEYQRSGDRSLMDPVMGHNLLDVKSLVAITVLASGGGELVIGEEEDAQRASLPGPPGEDLPGSEDEAVSLVEEVLEAEDCGGHGYRAMRDLSLLLKRRGRWSAAAGVWEEMAAAWPADAFAHLELAKYFEHRARDRARAAMAVRRGLECCGEGAPLEDLRKRLGRLERRGRARGR